MNMVLKPQDVLILLKLVSLGFRRDSSFAVLAESLYMSSSEVHAGLQRAQQARLYADVTRQPLKENLAEYLIHGVKYSFPVELGGKTRGMPTSYAAAPLRTAIDVGGESLPPVWPVADGVVLGLAFSPLYKSVPLAAEQDSNLYELLCLVDAIRSGRTREQTIASKLLIERIGIEEKKV
jgi:hypothetical protein